MHSHELFANLTARTQQYDPELIDDAPRWQDIASALAGVDPAKVAFIRYTFAGDSSGRHDFFSGLFMKAMQIAEIRQWRTQRKDNPGYHRAIETLCLLAVNEWGEGGYTDEKRAKFMGVSRPTWSRKYKLPYQIIVNIPKQWELQVLEHLLKRLR